MEKTFTDSFLDPLFIISYFTLEDDFLDSNKKQNIFYFIIYLIISMPFVDVYTIMNFWFYFVVIYNMKLIIK